MLPTDGPTPIRVTDSSPAAGHEANLPARVLSWLAAGYAIAYLAVQTLLSRDNPLRELVLIVGFLPFPIVTAIAFRRASAVALEAESRRAFGNYALSFAATAAGSIVSAWQQFVQGTDPTYSWANILYLLGYPTALAAILSFRASRATPADRWRLGIDTAIAVVAAATVTWLYIAAPLSSGAESPGQLVVLFTFPIGDLVLFAALVPVLLSPRAPEAARILRLLAASEMIYLAGDIGYQIPGTSIPGLPFDWPDFFYLAGYVGTIWAIDSFRRRPVALADTDTTRQLVPSARRNMLTIGLGLVVYGLLLISAFRPWTQPKSLLAVATVAVTMLILARERLTERQNIRLAGALQAERSEARFRNAIRHLRVGVIIQDAGSRVRVANPAALEMFGMTEDDEDRRLFGPGWSVIAEDGTPYGAENDPVALAIARKAPLRNMVIGVRRVEEVERRWLLVDADPTFTPDGAIDEVVVSFHDITEHRVLEEQLRQAQRMEAVGQLAGGIAHDFNNLLTAIIGHAALLQASLPANDPQADDAAEIQKAADRAARLTRQLLAFSRRQLLRPEVLDLNEVIRGTERLLQRLLSEDITIATNLAPESLPVLVDRGQLEQVIINLAVNARDAMPRGGRLEISTRQVRPGSPEIPAALDLGGGGVALLQVRDEGHGMDEATRVRAFEPFFTTKEVGKGTGLGLSTVYGIVRQSGGDVTIESEVGRGTVVSVYLPGSERPAEPAARPSVVEVPLGRETILVVEDEPALRRVVRQALSKQGYQVFEAAGPAAAKEILQRPAVRVDLLLADVVMPGGSGPELATWARRLIPTLRVILMTGYADEATLRYGLDSNQADLLQKPFNPSQLVSRIRATLDRPDQR